MIASVFRLVVTMLAFAVPAHATITSFSCYQTTTEMNTAIASLVSASPSLVTSLDIGDSWEKTQGSGGDDITAMLITDNNRLSSTKAPVVITCGLHAREYPSPQFCMDFAEDLVSGHATDANIEWLLANSNIYILPQANPDGRVIAEGETPNPAHRKNNNTTHCPSDPTDDPGVDLNRNFDFEWGTTGSPFSETDPCSDNYRGPSAASEPETLAVQSLIDLAFGTPDLPAGFLTTPTPMPDTTKGIYIDIHTGPFSTILWVFGFTATDAPNHGQLQTLARRTAFEMSQTAFSTTAVEAGAGIFTAEGAAGDYAYGTHGKPSIIYEIGGGFDMPCTTGTTNYTNVAYPALKASTINAIKSAQRAYVLPSGPTTSNITPASPTVSASSTFTLSATIDSATYCTATPCDVDPEPEPNIFSAEVYWDTPPLRHSKYYQQALPIKMNNDTALDSSSEVFSVTLTAPADIGVHRLYVRGRAGTTTLGGGADISEWGPIESIFVVVN